jgi:transposase
LADPVARGHRLSHSEETMSTSVSAYLGIDIAKDSLEACLLVGPKAWHGSFANNPAGFVKLDRWLKKRQVQRVHACLEATGRYSEGLAEHLHAAGHTVSVINPARLKAYAAATLTRTKNDPIDAALSAEFCRSQQPAAWTPPSPERHELRALVRRRESLLHQRQQEANRLSSGEDSRLVCGWLAASLAFLDEQLAQVEQAIKDQIADHPQLKRQHELIDSIPGIGPLTAAALLAELDFALYPTARQVAAQAGLTPRQRQSGTSVHGKPRLSKQGARQLRKILFFPAMVAKRYNPPIHAFAERLAERGKAKLAIVCACMRKLLHLVYGVLKSGLPFDPDYQPKRVQPAKSVKELQPA